MIEKKEIIRILRRMKLEHGPTVCIGCGHEHNCSIHGCAVLNDAIAMLSLQDPAEDAVPVVRCKDCVSCYECCDGTLRCDNSYEQDNMDRTVTSEWFCADGERKGGE